MMKIAVVGIDLGKNSCNLVALDNTGAVVKRRRMRRESIAEFTAKLAPCIVAMEACCGAHHLARGLKSQGLLAASEPDQRSDPLATTPTQLRVVEARWPDSRPVFWKPVVGNGGQSPSKL